MTRVTCASRVLSLRDGLDPHTAAYALCGVTCASRVLSLRDGLRKAFIYEQKVLITLFSTMRCKVLNKVYLCRVKFKEKNDEHQCGKCEVTDAERVS